MFAFRGEADSLAHLSECLLIGYDKPSNEVAAAQTERLESTHNGHSSSLSRTSAYGSQSRHSLRKVIVRCSNWLECLVWMAPALQGVI